MELRQRDKRKGALSFNSGGTVELDRYIARAESAAARAAESAAAAAAQLGQVEVNADAIAALRRDVDSIGEELPGKYTIPVEGIPKADLAEDVQTSLDRADTALQPDALSAYRTAAAQDEIDGGKQARLVSGENIKTVNGQTILGAGDLVIPYSRPNLLDNWYFGGSSQNGDWVFPINQRGQPSYTGQGLCVDRWEQSGDGIVSSISNNGIEITVTASSYDNAFLQTTQHSILYSIGGKELTLSVLFSNNYLESTTFTAPTKAEADTYTTWHLFGTKTLANGVQISYALSSSTINKAQTVIRIPRDGTARSISAVKLELGDCQTLAHQADDGSGGRKWVLNEIPNFGEELAKCQRYYVEMRGIMQREINGDFLTGNVTYPVPLVRSPTIIIKRIVALNGTVYTLPSSTSFSGTNISLTAIGTGALTFTEPYSCWVDFTASCY